MRLQVVPYRPDLTHSLPSASTASNPHPHITHHLPQPPALLASNTTGQSWARTVRWAVSQVLKWALASRRALLSCAQSSQSTETGYGGGV